MNTTKTLIFLAAAAGGLAIAGAGLAQMVVRTEIHRPAFADIDANHDGTISQAEFDAFKPPMPPGGTPGGDMGAPGMPPPPGRGPMGGHMGGHMMIMDIKSLDSNKDGKISQDEFLGPARDHFTQLDANHDGVLDSGELPSPPMPPMAPMPPAGDGTPPQQQH